MIKDNIKNSKFLVLIAVILMDVLSGAEVDLFTPSFPQLQRAFNLDPLWLESILSVNFIGYCLSLFFVGSLADHYTRRSIIITGLIIFILGSFFCLLAHSFYLLLVGRFLQGIGIAAPAILCYLIIADSYPITKQRSLIAMLNGISNISVGIAPVLGSYITMYFNWHGNFAALLILGLITLVMTIYFIIDNHKPIVQRCNLLSYKMVFESKKLQLVIINLIFMYTPYWIFVGMSPLLYMQDLGVSLSNFGYYQGALASIFAFGSILSSFIINKFDPKKMLLISWFICIFGLIAIAIISFVDIKSPIVITLVFMISIIGHIIPSVIIYPLSLNIIPQDKGKVSAILQGGRLILTAIGLEIAGYFYDHSFKNIGLVMTMAMLVVIYTLYKIIKNYNDYQI